jgi:hypothetical protein
MRNCLPIGEYQLFPQGIGLVFLLGLFINQQEEMIMTDYSKHYPKEHLLIVAKEGLLQAKKKQHSAYEAASSLFTTWKLFNRRYA